MRICLIEVDKLYLITGLLVLIVIILISLNLDSSFGQSTSPKELNLRNDSSMPIAINQIFNRYNECSGSTINHDGITTSDNSTLLPLSTLTTYKNPSIEFKVSAPDGWKQVVQDTGVYFISPPSDYDDAFVDQMNIDILEGNITLMKVIENFTSLPDFKLLDVQNLCLQNEKAFAYDYIYYDSIYGTDVAGFDVIIPDSNNSYMISFFSTPEDFSSYLSTIIKVLDSFDFHNVNQGIGQSQASTQLGVCVSGDTTFISCNNLNPQNEASSDSNAVGEQGDDDDKNTTANQVIDQSQSSNQNPPIVKSPIALMFKLELSWK